ncbi:MAG: hypothetical protein BGO78_07945 [Chloroflexi bacterium 44-23]|nr:MAG: hypothetical protein BGO78_07945 [Chloroflexi bacterium 44-23]
MKSISTVYSYPRRRTVRTILKSLIHLLFATTADFEIVGKENLPSRGPLLMVGNHFSFLDPLAMIRIAPWGVEFLGGTQTPNAPRWTEWLRNMWGFIPVFRGSVSRETFSASERIISQNGVLAIFPEGGNWANVLRPARPGVAFLAVRTGAPIIPVGFDGLETFLPHLRKGKRSRITTRIGKQIGPFNLDIRGRENRGKLDELGHEIMKSISELIPPDKRGYYSNDPAIREKAKGTEIYPWDDIQEG